MKAEIGSISHGTLRTADLLEAFSSELERIDPEAYGVVLGDTPTDDWEEWVDDNPEDAGYLLEALVEALDFEAPPYCYFGANNGDGSDYGFWPDICRVEEDRQFGDLPEREGLPEFAVEVNDHGNVTLYRIEYTEVWGIV